ncbi:hypothetical protein CFC21_101464 [Triticum aestivum]|uniref:Thioredoxin domain-containing protein n=2 Tax=Triticum aestivum TaxID=4565 RepID=A0A9R1M365_WHEAT|nr:hypothetical protein CFC21_101464 [Triticum aestivum]
MNSYYYYLEDSRQWFWWSGGWRTTNDGRRYPAVNIVILTEVSFEYVFGRKPLTEPPQDSSPGIVISIKDMDDWQLRWDNSARYNKLLVYSFYDKNSTLSKAMDKLLEKLAKQYKGKADFCKLDVDNFEVQTQPDDFHACIIIWKRTRVLIAINYQPYVQFLAGLCGVEGAYPTFVLFKKCKQVGKVVGLKDDELERSIERALN